MALANPRMQFDAGRTAQNMMVAAWALGVGTCPNTPIEDATLKQLLGLTPEMTVPTVLSLGYPAPGEPQPRPHAQPAKALARVNRLPLHEIAHWETYRNPAAS